MRRGLDGVITDDVAQYLRVCAAWDVERRKWDWGARQVWEVLRVNVMAVVFGVMFRWKFGTGLDVASLRAGDSKTAQR
ncbi:MAG: hypothetical protein INR71_05310 [Terriglobus roseus]|nr:hypothetical protein [Terriglobus roseus]